MWFLPPSDWETEAQREEITYQGHSASGHPGPPKPMLSLSHALLVRPRMGCHGRAGGLGRAGRVARGWLCFPASWRSEARTANRGQSQETRERGGAGASEFS